MTCVLLVVVAVLTLAISVDASPTIALQGDANCDGQVTRTTPWTSWCKARW
jgi:hypothetical protein